MVSGARPVEELPRPVLGEQDLRRLDPGGAPRLTHSAAAPVVPVKAATETVSSSPPPAATTARRGTPRRWCRAQVDDHGVVAGARRGHRAGPPGGGLGGRRMNGTPSRCASASLGSAYGASARSAAKPIAREPAPPTRVEDGVCDSREVDGPQVVNGVGGVASAGRRRPRASPTGPSRTATCPCSNGSRPRAPTSTQPGSAPRGGRDGSAERDHRVGAVVQPGHHARRVASLALVEAERGSSAATGRRVTATGRRARRPRRPPGRSPAPRRRRPRR